VSWLEVDRKIGPAILNKAAKRRKNAAHGASRGWQVEPEQAPTGRKRSYDTDPEGRLKFSRTLERPPVTQKRSLKRPPVRRATSQKAREVAHPQLFQSTSKDKPALYFPVKGAHPPPTKQTDRRRNNQWVLLVARS
jgi:hypothetical protein